MKSGWLKNGITYFFLLLVLSVKMAGLHALTHSGDQDHALHCSICDQAIAQDLSPALPAGLPEFTPENNEYALQREPATSYSFVISNALPSDQLFSRPPPALL